MNTVVVSLLESRPAASLCIHHAAELLGVFAPERDGLIKSAEI